MAARGICGVAKSHGVHIRALGLAGYHEWDPVPKEPRKQKAMAPRSEKMADFYEHERIPLNEAVFARAGYQCEIVSPWHERLADWNPLTVHEIATRGREGGIRAPGVNTMENCVAACLRCNQAMSENADWAEEHGWLKPASSTREDVTSE